MPKISAAEYMAFTRHDFYTFMHRAFCELNPSVPFLHNWHNGGSCLSSFPSRPQPVYADHLRELRRGIGV